MSRILAILFVAFISISTFGQLSEEDELRIEELKDIINSDAHDTLRIKAIGEWDGYIYYFDEQLDSALNMQVIEICEPKFLENGLSIPEQRFYYKNCAAAYNVMGLFFAGISQLDTAISFYEKGIAYYEKIGRLEGLDGIYSNMGNAYFYKGEFAKAIELFDHAIKITDVTNNLQFKGSALLSLGLCYSDIEDYDKAREYYYRTLDLCQEIDEPFGESTAYMNLGNNYMYREQYDSAFHCLRASIAVDATVEYYYTQGTAHHNLGECFLLTNQLDSAEFYILKGFELRKQFNDLSGITFSQTGLSQLYVRKKNWSKALSYALAAKEGALKLQQTEAQYNAMIALHQAAAGAGNYKLAYETHVEYMKMFKTRAGSANQKKLINQEVGYAYERQHFTDSLAFEQQEEVASLAHQAELDKEAQQRYLLLAGLGFFIIIGGLAYRGYRQKKKDNILIAEQKTLVEEAHQEITDSIAYAKRIQNAILPPDKLIKSHLPESFVLYLPKDVVAGDFYWLETKGEEIFFAAADCTGHGVPGAMVSVICNNGLNRAVREYGLTDPAKILDKARELVISEFEKSEEDVKDGMDISLCTIKGLKLKFAGANNPIWIIRNGELIEIKGDKQPVGKFEMAKPFTSHEFDLQKNDSLYLFSDGYIDQFGGDKGKKFKAKNFKSLLLSIQDKPLSEQEQVLNTQINDWKGDLEQLDDICVIGVRI